MGVEIPSPRQRRGRLTDEVGNTSLLHTVHRSMAAAVRCRDERTCRCRMQRLIGYRAPGSTVAPTAGSKCVEALAGQDHY